jgi:hypothetical protein
MKDITIIGPKEAQKLLEFLGINNPVKALDLHIEYDKPVTIHIEYYPRMDIDGKLVPLFKKYKLVEIEEEKNNE